MSEAGDKFQAAASQYSDPVALLVYWRDMLPSEAVDYLELSVRARNSLLNAQNVQFQEWDSRKNEYMYLDPPIGGRTMGGIEKASDANLLRMPNLGRTTLNEIRECFAYLREKNGQLKPMNEELAATEVSLREQVSLLTAEVRILRAKLNEINRILKGDS